MTFRYAGYFFANKYDGMGTRWYDNGSCESDAVLNLCIRDSNYCVQRTRGCGGAGENMAQEHTSTLTAVCTRERFPMECFAAKASVFGRVVPLMMVVGSATNRTVRYVMWSLL